ncbi:MAG: hypothetical protein GDA50_01345 [Alphaproteobacteria bacterium GM202ARS2]|nr:hypothetical protein [Alphaproteobacteria bacterium GM202ARS2]
MLGDYELIEMLLHFAIPQKDTKLQAKNLFHHHDKSFNKLFQSDHNQLLIERYGNKPMPKKRNEPPLYIALIRLVSELIHRTVWEGIKNKPTISSQEELVRYLRSTIGYKSRECLKIFFLDSKNHIISRDSPYCSFEIDVTINDPAYIATSIRAITLQALLREALGVIIAHNHPSGDTEPSPADIRMTKDIDLALKLFDITLQDHIIIGSQGVYSMREHNFI